MKDRFINLPNGDTIKSSSITAIRVGDAAPANEFCKVAMKPRVIIDFNHSCTICECTTNEERDILKSTIYNQCEPHFIRDIIKRIRQYFKR